MTTLPFITSEPLVVDAKELARLLDVSLRTIRRMDSAGKLPKAVRVGRAKRWLLADIRAWLEAGTPDRTTWDRMKQGRREPYAA